MGIRSLNYIALKPGVELTAEVAPFLQGSLDVSDQRGSLYVYESNFTPLWARDGKGINCVADLEEEVAIQRFLGSLPLDSFYMKRAGEEYGHRGTWAIHSFLAEEAVQEIEHAYAKGVGLVSEQEEARGWFEVVAYKTRENWEGPNLADYSLDGFLTLDAAKAYAEDDTFNDYYQVVVMAYGEHVDHEPGETVYWRFAREDGVEVHLSQVPKS